MKKRSEKRSDLICKLGKNIAYYRKDAGLSQEELAYKVDIMPATLSRIECGATDTSISTLEKIANALKVDISTLFEEAQVTPVGLPWEIDEIIRLLRKQKASVISAALKAVELIVSLVKNQK